MGYFYSERGKRYFVALMFSLACWLLASAATATMRDNARVTVDSRRIAATLLDPASASPDLSSMTILSACAHER